MNTGVISVRYARALLKCALEKHVEDNVFQEMLALSHNYAHISDLRQTIDNPMLHQDKKQELIELACGTNPTQLTKDFIRLVLSAGRENILQYIFTSYITLYRQQKHIISGKLITATAVTEDIEKRMEAVVHSQSKGIINFQSEVNPDIIGGFILEYDSYRMDASVQTKLNKILKQLKK